MDLSVVVPTLNGRDRLSACLDALSRHVPDAEIIVANGPSADGTTGMIRGRDDVDVLVEISDRTVTVARNAGFEVASGDVIAFVDYDNRVESTWVDGLHRAFEQESATAVTGPVCDTLRSGQTTESVEERRISGRTVTYFDGGNVAFRRSVFAEMDGFDEYLDIGGARDAAHRLTGMDHDVSWAPDFSVSKAMENAAPAADGGKNEPKWEWKYRALTYRLIKNYGLRPTVIRRTASHAISDSASFLKGVLRRKSTPSQWVGNSRDVLTGIVTGMSDGLVARSRDRTQARNPHGLSKRADRAVAKYDRRE